MSPKVSMHKYRSVGVTLLISTSVPRETYHNYFQVEFLFMLPAYSQDDSGPNLVKWHDECAPKAVD